MRETSLADSMKLVRWWLRSSAAATVLAILLCLAPAARAIEGNPLRPPDTSSPRATLQGFIDLTDHIYRNVTGALESYLASERLYLGAEEREKHRTGFMHASDAIRYLDVSDVPPVLLDTVAMERLVQLKEILDRIDLPAIADVPDPQQMAQMASKRWRLPNTEIDIVRLENGPRAGEYLFSASTVNRLPEFYKLVRHLPYNPGPGATLDKLFRTASQDKSATVYDGFLSSPVGLRYLIPPRWMLDLPRWAKVRFLEVATWQWLGLGIGLTVAAVIIMAGRWIGRLQAVEDHDAPSQRWQALAPPIAVVVAAGLVVPLFTSLLRIGGTVRMVVEYGATGALYFGATWLAVSVSVLAGELLVASERLTPRSLDSQLIRLGTRLIGLIAAAAILIRCGDELGFPAYSILAGLGVGGLAVALAAQSTIANLIGSMLIALEKPFRVGHLVRISGSEGTVEDVGFRSTRIRTADNTLVSIPSSTVVNTTVENLTSRIKRRERFFLQVTCDTPREKLEAVIAGIRQLIVDHPSAEERTCEVHFNNFGESSLDILVIFHLQVTTYADELREREAILLGIMTLLEDAGVELAFPTRTLHLTGAADNSAARPRAVPAPIGFASRS
jgi:MscS family membrane protein